jgi:hypothetical protein
MSDVMNSTHAASTCRWAEPTVFAEPPLWFYANDCFWTCSSGNKPRLLQTTNTCCSCPQWALRDEEPGTSRSREETPGEVD